MEKIDYKLVGQRLKEARIEKKISLENAGEKIGVHKTTIMRWEDGKTEKLDMASLEILAEYYSVNALWLMGKNVPKIAMSLKYIQEKQIPILGTVKAGYDYLAQENIIGHTYLDFTPFDIENYYALEVTGDSMEPLFSNGDVAIVHKQDDFESGNTCIVLINGDEATVKKVVKTEDGIDLIAMNPYYPVRHFTKEDMSKIPVQIIGKVVEARKRKQFE